MARRIHVSQVRPGPNILPQREAHHVRDVLRLVAGTPVELFDDAGNIGTGTISFDGSQAMVQIEQVHAAPAASMEWTIASAVPKGNRADWMIEKLSELGCTRFVPLAVERSIVLPRGENKRERWMRLAIEAAKQSRRTGTMEVAELTDLESLLATPSDATSKGATQRWFLSTEVPATPIHELISHSPPRRLTMFIGPEGGWSPAELDLFHRHHAASVRLTETILRIETAAIAAAAVVGAVLVPNSAGGK